ncbi:hypothetical protein WJX72_004576 [[Myrmecia] bisecta]|uniref:EF-hand domain-containing protein n=1 Tax=[Myrmecia] bisecta TaxID=41462 RepID=A0AAW1QQ86_9CHLO
MEGVPNSQDPGLSTDRPKTAFSQYLERKRGGDQASSSGAQNDGANQCDKPSRCNSPAGFVPSLSSQAASDSTHIGNFTDRVKQEIAKNSKQATKATLGTRQDTSRSDHSAALGELAEAAQSLAAAARHLDLSLGGPPSPLGGRHHEAEHARRPQTSAHNHPNATSPSHSASRSPSRLHSVPGSGGGLVGPQASMLSVMSEQSAALLPADPSVGLLRGGKDKKVLAPRFHAPNPLLQQMLNASVQPPPRPVSRAGAVSSPITHRSPTDGAVAVIPSRPATPAASAPPTAASRPTTSGSQKASSGAAADATCTSRPGSSHGRQPQAVAGSPGCGEPYHGPYTEPFDAAASAGGPANGLEATAQDPNIGEVMDRFRALYRYGAKQPVSSEEVAADVRLRKYNDALTLLKDRIYMKGFHAFNGHFQCLDLANSGTLAKDEFMAALMELNLGSALDEEILNMILQEAAATSKDAGDKDKVNYHDFAEALRMGRVQYRKLNPKLRHRALPDPESPLGCPKQSTQPYGILSDAQKNIAAFDTRINSMFELLEDTFKRFDSNGSGKIDWVEFQDAFEAISNSRHLQLSKTDVMGLFEQADRDADGAIDYKEFMQSFGEGARFIPEFLKPKSLRCSQMGKPWTWETPDDKVPVGVSKHAAARASPVPSMTTVAAPAATAAA